MDKLLEKEVELSHVTVTDTEVDELIGSSVTSDEPLVLAVKEEAKKRLLELKKSELIKGYVEALKNG